MIHLVLLPFIYFTVVGSLRDVVVDIPAAVTQGDTIVMTCTYDLEGDDLYSVKWYKGRQEFYRYVPKELPHIKVFPMFGINVDISQSGPTKVTLREVHWELSAKYRCEVSTDAPYFHTQVVGSHMHVVQAPSGKPSLRLEKTHYGLGETVRGNCSSPISSPASNITWLVNNKKEMVGNKILYLPSAYAIDLNMMKSSFENVTKIETNENADPVKYEYIKTAGIEFQVSSFHVGKLKIVCTADVYRVFSVSSEIILEEERPKLASIKGTYDTATGISNITPYTLFIWTSMAVSGLILSIFR